MSPEEKSPKEISPEEMSPEEKSPEEHVFYTTKKAQIAPLLLTNSLLFTLLSLI